MLNYVSDQAHFEIKGKVVEGSIIQELNLYMENYLETTLKIPIDKNYINIQSIAQNNDKTQILRMVCM